jgi:hypothetical protein
MQFNDLSGDLVPKQLRPDQRVGLTCPVCPFHAKATVVSVLVREEG